MDEIWERAVEAALDGQTDRLATRTLTLDGDVKCVQGRLPPPSLLERFQNLQHLSVANIGVSSLEQFPRLGNLQKLILSDNQITVGLEFLVEAGLDSLRDLDLSNNRIQFVEDLAPLAELKLVSLDLYECPVTRVKDYRSRVFGLIKTLKYLDKTDAEGNERPESDDEDDEEDEEEEEEEEEGDEEDPGSGEVDGDERTEAPWMSNGHSERHDGVVDVDEDEESDAEDDEAEQANGVNGTSYRPNGFRLQAVNGEEVGEDDGDDSESGEEICNSFFGESCSSATMSQLSNGDRKRKFKNRISDITKGSESVEISLVDDVGSEEFEDFPKFTYISHNTVHQSAYVHVCLARISDEDCCANCKGNCLSAALPCTCARETNGEYAYTKEGLLKEEFLDTCLKMKKEPDTFLKFYCIDCPLERDHDKDTHGKCNGHLIRKFIKECWRKCGCDMQCGNRVVQRGIRCRLQVYFTQEGKGWGLRTLHDLPKGTFVCEYIGEILTNTELYERNISSSSERHTYPITLDADWVTEKELKDEEALCLDATICGNVARFINHRCEDANMIDILVQIETPDRHYYHIAFFTLRDVKAMDELTWDYMIDFNDKSHPVKAFSCCCGSESCRDKKTKGSQGKSIKRRKIVPAKK